MDLFGKRRIVELEKANANLNRRLQEWESEGLYEQIRATKAQVEYLVRTIRDMDQEIYNMAQKIDWPAQRPHFVKLQEGMIARKHAENSRISDILRGELIETYKPQRTSGVGMTKIGKP